MYITFQTGIYIVHISEKSIPFALCFSVPVCRDHPRPQCTLSCRGRGRATEAPIQPCSLSGWEPFTCAASWMQVFRCDALTCHFFLGPTLQTHGIGPGLRMRYHQTAHHKLSIYCPIYEAIRAEILIKTAGSK